MPLAIAEIVLNRILFHDGNVWLLPIETPCPIWAGCFAVPATHAPIIVNYDNTIFFFPGSSHRTNVHAGRVFALKTLSSHIELARHGNIVLVETIRMIEGNFSLIHLENSDVLHVAISILIVLFGTCLYAIHITLAF